MRLAFVLLALSVAFYQSMIYAADGFVVTEQGDVHVHAPMPVAKPACKECERAGYDANGRKVAAVCGCDSSCSCGCQQGLPCTCMSRPSSCGPGGCGSYSQGSGGPARYSFPTLTRRFGSRPRFFGRFRGGCRSCR